MGKQPYIPFYIGDYIRDTRILPLNVRGGWVELILQAWDSDGEIVGTIEDFSRLMCCPVEEANLVIQKLKQKKIFDWEELSGGEIKIICRKIRKMRELSEIRKKSGSKGGNPNLVKQKQTKSKKSAYSKSKQIPENENEVENDTANDLENRKQKFELIASQYRDQYSEETVKAFCDYWTEHNVGAKKMRFEMQKVFGHKQRLATWKKNEARFRNSKAGFKSNIDKVTENNARQMRDIQDGVL